MNAHSPSAPQLPLSTNDPVAICHRLAGYDFPWELNRSFEVAVLRTFCVPRIAHLLHRTGKFERAPQQRYDDTGLILGNILKWGYDSPQGQAAIRQMNIIHSRYPICNEDFLYVLSTLIYEPVRWNRLFGWRPFSSVEKEAMFQFWRVVGQRMGLTNIPETYAAFQAFSQDYEKQHFRYHRDNAAIGNAVLGLMQSWYPAIATPVITLAVKTVADDAMRTALGWSQPHPRLSQLVLLGLQARQQIAAHLPRRRQPHFAIDQANRTYPDGYEIEQLGLSTPAESSRCPFLRMRAVLKGEL